MSSWDSSFAAGFDKNYASLFAVLRGCVDTVKSTAEELKFADVEVEGEIPEDAGDQQTDKEFIF